MRVEPACATFGNVFTPEDIASIRVLGERIRAEQAQVSDAPKAIRSSHVAWLDPDGWLGEHIEELVTKINDEFFDFELTGFADPFQYTVYNPGGHYGWHMDKGHQTTMPRKLSLTIQLSAPDEYEGGELEINSGNAIETMPKDQGGVIAFPSWILHRVTPVTRGVRRSLVVWACGEAFR